MDKIKLKGRKIFLPLFSCMIIGSICMTSCSDNGQPKETEWQPVEELTAEVFDMISLDDDSGYNVEEISYCDKKIFYTYTSPYNMREFSEYSSLYVYDILSGTKEKLYDAGQNHIMQDLIATMDSVFWVEIFYSGMGGGWKIKQYGIADKSITVLQEGILGKESRMEPFLTLSENGILWDIKMSSGKVKSYIYKLDTNQIIEKQLIDLNFDNPYTGNRLYNGELLYLSGKSGAPGEQNTYQMKNEEGVICEITVDKYMLSYGLSDSGAIWMTEGVASEVWFEKKEKGKLVGFKEQLPYSSVFAVRLINDKIVLVTISENYYVLYPYTGKRYKIPISGSCYPRYSADGVLYFEGHGKCFIMKMERL